MDMIVYMSDTEFNWFHSMCVYSLSVLDYEEFSNGFPNIDPNYWLENSLGQEDTYSKSIEINKQQKEEIKK